MSQYLEHVQCEEFGLPVARMWRHMEKKNKLKEICSLDNSLKMK